MVKGSVLVLGSATSDLILVIGSSGRVYLYKVCCRDARVDGGGYPPRKGGPFGRTGEDYNERPRSLQPFGGINNYILAGTLLWKFPLT